MTSVQSYTKRDMCNAQADGALHHPPREPLLRAGGARCVASCCGRVAAATKQMEGESGVNCRNCDTLARLHPLPHEDGPFLQLHEEAHIFTVASCSALL